jgi:hypothetical protein
VLCDATLHLVERPLAIRPLIVDHVLGGFVESQSADRWRDGQAMSPIAFPYLQERDRGALLLAAGTFFASLPIARIANPPNPAALS